MRSKFHLSTVVPLLLAAAGLAVTACGGSSSPSASPTPSPSNKTAAQVLPAMQSAVKSATSVHMAGSTADSGQKVTFDLDFYGKSDLAGNIAEGGGKFSMLAVSGKVYIKADAGFLKFAKVPASACAVICGKYIVIPSSEAGQITGSLSMSTLSNQAFGKLPASVSNDTSDKFVPATFDGQPVLTFHGGGYTIDVASAGTPYPVFVADATGDQITFSDWNSVPAPKAPPASKVIDISKL